MGNLCKKSDTKENENSDDNQIESKVIPKSQLNNMLTTNNQVQPPKTNQTNSHANKITPNSNNHHTNSNGTLCHNCNKRFRDEDLIMHYQVCFNNNHNSQQINEVINFINSNNNILNQINDANPFVPDNLNEYIDWELKKNPDTGINIWFNKGKLYPTGKLYHLSIILIQITIYFPLQFILLLFIL